MRIAVLSDIHGNLPALEAVLADAKAAAPDLVVNLGDIVSGPLWPSETADFLIPLGFPTIRGNHDRNLLGKRAGAMGPSDLYAAKHLTTEQRNWIGRMPALHWLDGEILLCHATPDSDDRYYTETVDEAGARPATPDEVRDRTNASAMGAKLILCGHSHLPRTLKLADGPLVLNPGSVGLPAYFDKDPFPHVMETGAPHARYAIVTRTERGWGIDHRAVSYDHQAAAARAARNGRPDWANALATGRAPALQRA